MVDNKCYGLMKVGVFETGEHLLLIYFSSMDDNKTVKRKCD